MSAPARGHRFRWAPQAALFGLALLPYLPGLAQPFFADDYIHLERAAAASLRPASLMQAWVLRADDTAAWWTPPELALHYFRPLGSLSFLADHALWARSPLGMHLTSLLVHAATTLVAHAVARRLLAPAGAWLAAALFALHPCHAEAVLWISARADLLCALFYLAALLFHLQARTDSGHPWIWRAASGASLALGLAAKEMALSFPLVVLLEAWLFPRGEPLRRRLAGPVLAAAVVGTYLLCRWSVVGPLGLPPRPFALHPADPGFVAGVSTAVLQYLIDLVLFVPADPIMTAPFWHAHPIAFALVVSLALAVLLPSLRAARGGLRGFAPGFVFLSLLPVLPLTVGEHLLYLPSFGYCLLLAPRLEADAAGWPRLRPKLALVAALVIGVALARTLAFGALARASRQTIDDALLAWDAAPRAATLLVVDLPGPAALGFAHALRGERPDRPPQVEILTLSPQALPGGAATTSRIEWEGVSRFVLRRDEPLLGSYIERAFAGDRASFADGESVRRDGLTVTVRDVRDGRPQALEVSLAPDRPALLLQAEGYRLRAVTPAR